METKFFLKSKEFWVLGLAVIFMILDSVGLDPEGIWGDAQAAYVTLSPFIALVLRVFWTKSKLRLAP